MLALVTAGCLGDAVDSADTGFEGAAETDYADLDDLVKTFSGTLTGTPVAPGEEAFTFNVPRGAVEVQATLTWGNAPVTDFSLELEDARGDMQGRGFPEDDGQLSVATVDPPWSGEWTAHVTASRAVEQDFDLEIRVSFLVPLENYLADEVSMRAGTFREINLIMEEGASFNWSFESSNGPVNWDIHSHPDGETKYHQEGTDESHEGRFTAPSRDVFSILFQSTQPTTVTYEVEGAFRVHSHSR
jgi:hypothetical protein